MMLFGEDDGHPRVDLPHKLVRLACDDVQVWSHSPLSEGVQHFQVLEVESIESRSAARKASGIPVRPIRSRQAVTSHTHHVQSWGMINSQRRTAEFING